MIGYWYSCFSVVYAEKKEADDKKEAHLFNCAQRVWFLIFGSFFHLNNTCFQVPIRTRLKTFPSSIRRTLSIMLFLKGINKWGCHHSTLLTALKFPVFAATALGFWSLSRVSYTRGYITGDPKKVRTTYSSSYTSYTTSNYWYFLSFISVEPSFTSPERWQGSVSLSAPVLNHILCLTFHLAALVVVSVYISGATLYEGLSKLFWAIIGKFLPF